MTLIRAVNNTPLAVYNETCPVRDAKRVRNLYKTSSVFFVACLHLTQGFAIEENGTVKVAVRNSESRETATWEEPSLFPSELPESSISRPKWRNERLSAEGSATIPPSTPIETDEAKVKHSAATFQSEFDEPLASGATAVGLRSTRERDAILNRIQSDTSSQPYNIKIGRIPLQMSASFDAEFSDNSDRTSQDQQSDLILLPRVSLTGSVKIISRLSLTINLGIGYLKDFANSDNDRVLPIASLSPNTNSGISLDLKVGKFLISVYDNPSVPQFQADAVTQRNQSQYRQFSNTAGITVLWNVNSRTNMSFRYDHSNAISLTSDKSTSDGSTDSFLASLSCTLSESLGIGVETGTEKKAYEGSLLNNGSTYHIGPFVDYKVSRYTRVQASAGYQIGDYGNNGNNEDASSLGGYYTNISIANELNSRLRHSLTFGHESQPGSISNYAINNYVRYQLNWDLVRGVNLGATASFEDIDESGGLFAEHFRNYSFGVYCGFMVTKHINISLLYAYAKRSALSESKSQGDPLDYAENRISLHLGYSF